MSEQAASAERKAVIIDVDTRLFSPESIKKVAHRLAMLGTFDVAFVSSDCVRISVTTANNEDASTVERRVRETLIEQDWRETVSKKTEPLRNLIVAQAFSPFSLIVPEADSSGYHDDVLGIAIADRSK
jgi:His-Xaa-Ser system protein HxsD